MINDHVESITQDLKITKKLYDERWKDLFQIEKDYEVINHQVRQMIESGWVSYGSLARPRSEINDQMKKAWDSVMYDMSVVDLLNKNSVMMNQDEQKTIFNTIQAIKHSAKSLLANYGQISEYGWEIISEALKNWDSVIKLDLNGNNIGLKGCKSISDMLTINLYLQWLRLSCNNLDDKWVIQLIEGLKINKSLTTLYLNDNHITDEGAIALCDLLSTVDNESNKLKSNISCLFMDKNYIKEQGGKAFAEMLKINNNINALYLNNNWLGNKGVIAITHSVEGTL